MSANHQRTIHGGLRYLQSADLARMRESIRERRAFARMAPRFVAPLAFAMPTGTSLSRNPISLRTALALDALVGRDRNDGLDPGHHLPAGHVIAGQECRDLFDRLGFRDPVKFELAPHDVSTLVFLDQ